MAGDGADAAGAVLHHQVGSLRDGAGRVDHVVDDDDVLALHVADDLHRGHLVGTSPRLVAEHERAAQVLGVRVGALRATHVGRGDDQVLEVEALDVGQHDAGGVEVVDGNVEEALLLVGMQVHGDEAVDAGHAEHVGHELGADGHAGLVLAVLTCPSEVGDDGVDGTCRGALGGINHQEQLHEVVAVGERALHEEDVAAAYRLLVADGKLAVGELRHLQFTQRAAQTLADFLCQIAWRCPRTP